MVNTASSSGDFEELLRSLIGRDTQIIYLEECFFEFGEGCVESKRFFISMKNDNYLEFSLEWKDLNGSLDTECHFVIALSDGPDRPSNHGCISLGAVSKVVSIEVYSGVSSEDGCHSKLIVLLRGDGKKLAFFGGDSAFRNIVFFISNDCFDDFLGRGNFSLELKL